MNDIKKLLLELAKMVYNYLMQSIKKLELEKEEIKLKLRYKENEDKIEKANSNKSDIDIINDAISEGRDIGETDS